MNTTRSVRSFIEKQRLLSKGDHVLVGVSGGADSICLLHILMDLRAQMGIKISVAHIDHQLRRNSDQDQKSVKKVARDLAVPYFSVKIPKTRRKGSLEEWAREARLTALADLAQKHGIEKIALAHHQDDLAETALMRIIRGTGLLGLQGILPKRTLKDCTLIRPLLNIKRSEIESFLKKKKITYRTDPTNRQTKFFRNKVRLQLLPLLERGYNKDISSVLANLANSSSLDYRFLSEHAQKKFRAPIIKRSKDTIRISSRPFLKQDQAIQRLLLRMAIKEIKGNIRKISLEHILEVEDLIATRPLGSTVHLPQKISVEKQKDCLVVTRYK